MERFKQFGEDIVLGPQPSAEDLEQARQRGIKTVIDLRMPDESPTDNRAFVETHGLRYANIPVSKSTLSQQKVDALDAALKEMPAPFLIHCATGTRVALLLCISEARRFKWSVERTFEEARKLGFDLQASPDLADFVRRSVIP